MITQFSNMAIVCYLYIFYNNILNFQNLWLFGQMSFPTIAVCLSTTYEVLSRALSPSSIVPVLPAQTLLTISRFWVFARTISPSLIAEPEANKHSWPSRSVGSMLPPTTRRRYSLLGFLGLTKNLSNLVN